MQKWILAIAVLALSISNAGAQSYEERVQEYISRYKDLAMREQQRSGIPASITLAQGIHETQAGKSELATNANNHFGIKCKRNWTGDTYTYTDDAPDECFRKYASPEQSYVDHSDYLKNSPRYAKLFTYSQTDYASWAFGLKKCGYATNPRYPQILINLIQEYKLQEYTYAAKNNHIGSDVALQDRENEIIPEDDAPPATATISAPVAAAAVASATAMPQVKHKSKIVVNENADEAPAEKPEFPPYGDVVHVNGLKAVYARQGDMPLEYALKTGVRYEKLLEINEISDKPLAEDMYLYLERRHLKGIRPTHTVKEGETIAQAARYEGMQEKALRTLNQLNGDEEPVSGTVLQLQSDAPVKPEVIAKAAPAPEAAVAATAPAPPAAAEQETPPAAEEQPAAPPAAEATTDNTVATTPVEEAQTTAPVEENTLAGNTAGEAEPVMPPPPPPPAEEQSAATQEVVVEKADIGPAVPAGAIKPKEEVAETGSNLPNPPPPPVINIANEKPIEETLAEEKKANAGQTGEEPKDELDALKARFDKVVYAERNKPVTEQADTVAEPATGTTAEAPQPDTPKEAPAAKATGGKFYTVKKGDTAFGIAKRNNITMRQLMEWNNLDFEAIKIGQRLRVKP